MIKNCLNCQKEIRVKPSHYSRKKFCSKNCQTKYYKNNPPEYWKKLSKKVSLKCNYCGKSIDRKPSSIKEHVFCNRDCYLLYKKSCKSLFVKKKTQRTELFCEYCHEKFYVIPSRAKTAKYCSKNCLGKANGIRTKKNLSRKKLIKCSNCQKEFFKKRATIRILNFCNKRCMSNYYSKTGMFAGANRGKWTGGKISYYGPNWHMQRRRARARDNYTCQDCGITENEYGQELSVHHIIPFKAFKGDWESANKLSNLISLCEHPCHRKKHSRMVDDIV